MILSLGLQNRLRDEHGIYAAEACDRCGQILGAVRFTRSGDAGVWCSRRCRDGADAKEPKTCQYCRAKLPEGKRRGAVFCDDACRKASRRQDPIVQKPATAKLSRTKPSIYAVFSSDKQAVGMLGHPGPFESPEADDACM